MGIEEEAERILEEATRRSEFVESAVQYIESNTSLDEGMREVLLDKTPWTNMWEYLQNSQWCRQNLEWIKEKHGGGVVLVFQRGIIFSSGNMEEARAKLRSLGNQMHQCYACFV